MYPKRRVKQGTMDKFRPVNYATRIIRESCSSQLAMQQCTCLNEKSRRFVKYLI